MDAHQFDVFARAISVHTSRRGALAGLASGLLLPLALGGHAAKAKKKRKQHKKHPKKPPLNSYGCVDVGLACNGNDNFCCSGNCQGERPAKGKPDTSLCVAHHEGGCTPETTYCTAGTLNSRCGTGVVAACLTTTGKADFCGNVENFIAMNRCGSCRTDADCEVLTGPGSACVVIDGGPHCSAEHSCKAHGSNGTTCMPAGV